MALNFHDELMDSLKDPKEAAAYLQAALLEGDADTLLLAIQTLAKAKGGMALLAKKTGLDRVHLYRLLGKGGNPSFRNMLTILDAFGMRLDLSQKLGKTRKSLARMAA